MDNNKLLNSIAYCGLICKLCFQADGCDGCKSTNSTCERDLSIEGCFQKECCIVKGYDGCWECADLSKCVEGIFSDDNYSKVKAFALFIKKYNKEDFINSVNKNIQNGLSVQKGNDLDNLNIEEVHRILKRVL